MLPPFAWVKEMDLLQGSNKHAVYCRPLPAANAKLPFTLPSSPVRISAAPLLLANQKNKRTTPKLQPAIHTKSVAFQWRETHLACRFCPPLCGQCIYCRVGFERTTGRDAQMMSWTKKKGEREGRRRKRDANKVRVILRRVCVEL